jgi:hypothetical protein
MPGEPAAISYKTIQRFLAQVDPREALLRLFQERDCWRSWLPRESTLIRLHLGGHPPVFNNAEGERVELFVAPGKKAICCQIYYCGQVPVNVIGIWRKGFKRPLWVMTNLVLEGALHIYRARMKIDESYRDLKSLLNLDKIMNKGQVNMEKMVALLPIAYAIGVDP